MSASENQQLSFQQPKLATEFGVIVPLLDPPQAIRVGENDAYQRLIFLNGRPSHPFEKSRTIARDPGKFRDIVSYWQKQPGSTTSLYLYQLHQWQDFLWCRQNYIDDAETEEKSCGVGKYLEGLKSGLECSGFDFSPYMAHLASGLKKGAKDDLGAIVDWIGFFNYQFMRRMEWEGRIQSLLKDWNKQWQNLVASGVLTTDEAQPSNAFSLCHRSFSEIVRESRRRRLAVAEFERSHAVFRSHKRGSIRTASGKAKLLAEEERRKRLKNVADELSRRHEFIRRFMANTDTFRLYVEQAEKQDLLLTWILQQLPLVAQEFLNEDVTFPVTRQPQFNRFVRPLPIMERGGAMNVNRDAITEDRNPPAAKDDTDNETRQTFTMFTQLPQEIRRHIWLECLPRGPTAHFFSVVNHPHPSHLRSSWNMDDFRIQPSSRHDSGYRVVYPLVSSCREAREMIWAFYRSLLRPDNINVASGPLDGERINFETFDWIPPSDLMVLCLPPIQDKLSPKHCITFEYNPAKPARHVAVLASMEMFEGVVHGMDHDVFIGGTESYLYDQLDRVSNMVHALYNTESTSFGSGRSRIGKLYIAAEGWNAVKCASGVQDMATGETKLRKCRYEVHRGQENINGSETAMAQLGSVSDTRDQYLFHHSDAQALERQIWWLSDGRRGLALMEPSDMVDTFTCHKLARMTEAIIMGGLSEGGETGSNPRVDALCWVGPNLYKEECGASHLES